MDTVAELSKYVAVTACGALGIFHMRPGAGANIGCVTASAPVCAGRSPAMDTEAVRIRLLRQREELQMRARRASADLRHETDPLSADFAEQVTQRESDEVLGLISESAREELRQIQAALQRLDAGRYSTCAVCGQPIEEGRLAAVPYTDRCRACAGAESGGPRRAG